MSRTDKNIDLLLDDLACDDMIKCQKARRSLVAMQDKAVGPLAEALGNKKHWVRWEAAKALSQIGDATATEALVTALEDREFDVRWLAAEGLINIGHKALIPLLRALVKGVDSIWLREGAHHVLHDMNLGNLENALRPVKAALRNTVPALEVLGAAGQALKALQESKSER